MAQAQAARDPNAYFVPHHSRWPLFASVALFVTMYGLASWFNEDSYGKAMFFVGIAGMIVILFKWFAVVFVRRRARGTLTPTLLDRTEDLPWPKPKPPEPPTPTSCRTTAVGRCSPRWPCSSPWTALQAGSTRTATARRCSSSASPG